MGAILDALAARASERLEKQAKGKLKPGSLKGGPSQPASKAKIGTGGRFKALEKDLAKKGEEIERLSGEELEKLAQALEKCGYTVRDPGALAASIGRAKYGKKKFQEMAAAGRKKKDKKEKAAEAIDRPVTPLELGLIHAQESKNAR